MAVSMSPSDVLRRCGVKPQEGEDLWGAVSRYARQHKWKDDTRIWWEKELQRAFASRAESSFGNLNKLNEWLVGLGLPKAKSMKAARSALKTVHINIYDLLEKHYDQIHQTVAALRKYTLKHGLVYPLQQAKDKGLRD